MKKIIFLTLILSFALSGILLAQNQRDRNRAANIVNHEGILLRDMAHSYTLFEDFLSQPTDSVVHTDYPGWSSYTDTTGSNLQGNALNSSSYITNGVGGIYTIVNPDSENTATVFYYRPESFTVDTTYQQGRNKSLIYEARLKFSEFKQSDILIGLTPDTLHTGATSVIGDSQRSIRDGIYFYKTDGDSNFYGVVVKDFNFDTVRIKNWTLPDDDSWNIFTIEFNGRYRTRFTINHRYSAVTDSINLTPTNELLTPVAGVKNGSATAVTWYCDYIYIRQERETYGY